MRCLAIDPGAKRLGWAVLEKDDAGYRLVESGIRGLDPIVEGTKKEPFQAYRGRLFSYWADHGEDFIGRNHWPIDHIYSELQPAKGSGNYIAAGQAELAKMTIIILRVFADQFEIPWTEYPANTIKKRLTGTGKATKVRVRNVVLSVFPELLPRKKELTVVSDESDAIGNGLVGLGYRHGKR